MTLIKGDCIEAMADFEDESIDLVVCDPPFGISLAPTRKTSKFAGKKIANDDDLEWVAPWYAQLYRVSKNVCYVFCGWSTNGYFQDEARKAGFEVKNMLVWDKMHFGLGYNFRPQYELILVLTKKMFKTKRHNLSNILSFKRMHHTKMLHVAEKPIDLLKLLIEESSEEGDVVMDCFAGSFSTGEAALLLNREFIGIELDKENFDKGSDRLARIEE